jgi:hypothetical protein
MSSPMMNSFVIFATNIEIFSGRRPSVCQENFLKYGEGASRHHLQHVALVWLSFGPSGGDVGPGDSHVRHGVYGHEAWFFTDPAL